MLILSLQWMYNLVDFFLFVMTTDVSRNCVYCSVFKEFDCDYKKFFNNSVTGKTKPDFSHDQKWVNSNFFDSAISRHFHCLWNVEHKLKRC